jgi:hypothetical protein
MDSCFSLLQMNREVENVDLEGACRDLSHYETTRENRPLQFRRPDGGSVHEVRGCAPCTPLLPSAFVIFFRPAVEFRRSSILGS